MKPKPKPQQSTLAFSTSTKKDRGRENQGEADKDEEMKDEEDEVKVAHPDRQASQPEVVAVDSASDDRSTTKKLKREKDDEEDEGDDPDDQPVTKRRKRSSAAETASKKADAHKSVAKKTGKTEVKEEKTVAKNVVSKKISKSTSTEEKGSLAEDSASEQDLEQEEYESEEEKPETAAIKREKVQSTLKSTGKDPCPDWKAGDPVPYAALCTTFSLIEMTTKRLIILAHCSLFLRQVLRLTPKDLLPTIQLMINKLAADYAGIELGIGESLIMKAIGESTGRSLAVIKADQHEIGDLGLVALKSRTNQPTMFKPKPLTVRGVHEGLLVIAKVQGHGAQDKKISGIKKLLSAADASLAGKGSKGIDITKDKGGASEAKFIIRFLEGKLRLGLAEKTVLVALAQAMVAHEVALKGNQIPSTEQLAKGEAMLKTVYRYINSPCLK